MVERGANWSDVGSAGRSISCRMRQGPKRMRKVAILVMAAFCISAPSSSFAGASEAEKEAACKDDAMRLCFENIPDRDEVAQCMKRKIVQLSPACRAIFEEEAKKNSK
jgi:hypothetical protein